MMKMIQTSLSKKFLSPAQAKTLRQTTVNHMGVKIFFSLMKESHPKCNILQFKDSFLDLNLMSQSVREVKMTYAWKDKTLKIQKNPK